MERDYKSDTIFTSSSCRDKMADILLRISLSIHLDDGLVGSAILSACWSADSIFLSCLGDTKSLDWSIFSYCSSDRRIFRKKKNIYLIVCFDFLRFFAYKCFSFALGITISLYLLLCSCDQWPCTQRCH